LSFVRSAVAGTPIAFLAAVPAIAFLQQGGILTTLDETVWDTSWLLSDSSFLGRALIGYVDQPRTMQLIVFATLMKLFVEPVPSRVRKP
jgi:high-affinity iron transporter